MVLKSHIAWIYFLLPYVELFAQVSKITLAVLYLAAQLCPTLCDPMDLSPY